MNHKLYHPILKAKKGEISALGQLEENEKARITPLMEVVPIPFDFESKKPKKDLKSHVTGISKNMARHWGTREFWLDTHLLEKDAASALISCQIEAKKHGAQLVPVIRVDSSKDLLDVAKGILDQTKKQVVLRVTEDYFTRWAQSLPSIKEILSAIDAETKDTHIVIDLGSIAENIAMISMSAREVLKSLPAPSGWSSITVAAGAFPENLAGIKSGTTARIPRNDYSLWRHLIGDPELPFRPIFSDYGIGHPQWVDLDYRLITMSGSIRYTGDESWIIVKGFSIKTKKWDQMRDHSRTLLELADFHVLGTADVAIQNCASGKDGTGNATTWRQIGTARHIVKTLNQIASLS